MSDEDIITALRRKAGKGRPPPDVLPLSPEKALRLATSKAAQDLLQLPLLVTEITERRSATTLLAEAVPENALISLLQGPSEAFGLAIFDVPCFSAVVEQQTAGRVLPFEPENRPPTSTDAMMCSGLIDQILYLFETELASLPDAPAIKSYRVAAQLNEARSIALAFEDLPYRIYDLTLSVGSDGRSGKMLLAFPLVAPKPKADAGSDEWGEQFQSVVMRSEANLDSVLHRIEMTLADVMALQVGDVLSVPTKAVSRVEVWAGDQFVTKARLGQFNGARALRVVMTPDAEDGPDILDPADGDMMGSAPLGLDMETGEGFPDLGGFDTNADGGGMVDLPALGDMPAMDGGGDLPPLGDLPPMGDLPALGEGGDLPSLDDVAATGDLPDLGDLPDIGDLPDLPDMGDLPPLDGADELPPLGDLPPLGELPSIE